MRTSPTQHQISINVDVVRALLLCPSNFLAPPSQSHLGARDVLRHDPLHDDAHHSRWTRNQVPRRPEERVRQQPHQAVIHAVLGREARHGSVAQALGHGDHAHGEPGDKVVEEVLSPVVLRQPCSNGEEAGQVDKESTAAVLPPRLLLLQERRRVVGHSVNRFRGRQMKCHKIGANLFSMVF